jgi:aminoglycoside phosphotransferase (APT) family kinase protein
LFARWPDRVSEVLARDDDRGWLLLADAGTPLRALGNPPEVWLRALPMYAELQRDEAKVASDHLAHGVPDLRVMTWQTRYAELVQSNLPLQDNEVRVLREFARRFGELCEQLAAHGVPETVQHDDLHMGNVYKNGEQLRLLDWGDSSISHPFASLVITFRFLEEVNGLSPADRQFSRLRDAYLEPWGSGRAEALSLAIRIGSFARAFALLRQRDALPQAERAAFDSDLRVVLRRALAQTTARGGQ